MKNSAFQTASYALRGRFNLLWVRLSLAFGLVVILSAGSLFIASTLIARANLPTEMPFLLDINRAGGLVDQLAALYQSQGDWAGADWLLRGVEAVYGDAALPVTAFIFRSADGSVVYDSLSQAGLSQVALHRVVVDGQTVGELAIAVDTTRPPPGPENFLLQQLVNFLALISIVGTVIGIGGGVLMSRSLTAPLERLAVAARRLAARDLSQRVAVTGSDELRDLAHAFNEMASALAESERLRSHLIADIAHEIRTPLTVLQGNLRAIIDGVYALNTAEVISIYDQTRLLSRLVNDLHELALSDARQLALHRQPVDLAALLIDAIVIFEAVAESEGVTVDVQVSQPPPQPVVADPVRLKQVIHNLLVNALRHTAAGGRIALELTAQAGGVQLAIQDTGVGIPANHLPHIFERFYRVDPARGRESGGTGLGLAIVRALIEAHGGTISVYSRTGENAGTTFTIFLPDAYAYEQQS